MKHTTKRWKDLLAGSALTALILGLFGPALAATGGRTADIRYADIALRVNGQTITLRDDDGDKVEPFVMDGTVYLPARALGEALGMQVSWKDSALTMKGAIYDEGDYIGKEAAKTAALKHAGVAAKDATFTKVKLDWDDGRMTYDVEFYSGNMEYDYELDALTGDVCSMDHDYDDDRYDDDRYDNDDDNDDLARGNYITLEKARSLAQAKAPNATLRSCQLDWDDGRAIYEGELKDGPTEYEFEIDATTGSFLQWEVDHDD